MTESLGKVPNKHYTFVNDFYFIFPQKTLSNPPSWLTESLGKGELTIRVYTSIYVIEPIFGTLPAISTVN